MGKYKRRGVARFLSLPHQLLKSHAWHRLTPLQRCGYIEISQLYDGTNNGRLAMSTRRLAGLIPCSKNSRILNELEDAGFIETVRMGHYTRKAEERTATEYRLTDLKCDVTGELPTRKYNERHRWEPGEKPKRKALTDAERAKRYRKKRHADRTTQWDATVPMVGADSVTASEGAKREPQKNAKNVIPIKPSVTVSVPPTGTHIHLTRGGGDLGHPPSHPPDTRSGAKLAGNNNFGLPPGHSHCNPHKGKSLPPGWHWCLSEKAVVTDTGVVVPSLDDPLVGTDEQRAAFRLLALWQQRRSA